jgi:hypothetical protein
MGAAYEVHGLHLFDVRQTTLALQKRLKLARRCNRFLRNRGLREPGWPFCRSSQFVCNELLPENIDPLRSAVTLAIRSR